MRKRGEKKEDPASARAPNVVYLSHLHGRADGHGLVRVHGAAQVQGVAGGGEEGLELVLEGEDARRAAHEHAVRNLKREKSGGGRG